MSWVIKVCPVCQRVISGFRCAGTTTEPHEMTEVEQVSVSRDSTPDPGPTIELPYTYKLVLEVEIRGDGMHADGDGAKATADRLVRLLMTDRNVTDVQRWPRITYEGKRGRE